jgi:hypothetical protein
MSYQSALSKYQSKNKKRENHLALLDDLGYDKPTYGAVKLQPLHKNQIVPYGELGIVFEKFLNLISSKDR